MLINTYDIDGVINLETHDGVYPGKNDFIITGRSIEEAHETIEMLHAKQITNQVFFNYLPFEKKTRESSGKHKAFILKNLLQSGFKIGIHFEDDEIQAKCIEEECPDIKIVILKHNLVNKENIRRK